MIISDPRYKKKTIFNRILMLLTLFLTLNVGAELFYVNLVAQWYHLLLLFSWCILHGECKKFIFVSWSNMRPIMWLLCCWDKPLSRINFYIIKKGGGGEGTQIEFYIRDVVACGNNLSNAIIIIIDCWLVYIYFHYM